MTKTITKIVGAKKKPNRVLIYLDDEYAFSINQNLLVDFKLFKGKGLEDQDISKILSKDIEKYLLERSFSKVAKRPHSNKEIRFFLKKKVEDTSYWKNSNYPIICIQEEVIIDNTVKELEKLNLIDDREFAKFLYTSYKDKKSIFEIRRILKSKGISEEIIQNVLPTNQGENSNLIQKLIQKKIRLLANKDLPIRERKQKIITFLLRKGFQYDKIKTLVSEELKNTNLD